MKLSLKTKVLFISGVFVAIITIATSSLSTNFFLKDIFNKKAENQIASVGGLLNQKIASVDQFGVNKLSSLPSGALSMDFVLENNKDSLKPVLYISKNGEDAILMSQTQMATMPAHISDQYYKDETNGYIVKFKQIPLALKNTELNTEINKLKNSKIKTPAIESSIKSLTEAKKSKLLVQLNLIEQEQVQTINQIKNLVKTTNVKKTFSRSFNGVSLDITDNEAEALKINGFDVYPNGAVKAVLDQSVPLIEADKVWQMKDFNGKNITGQGIKIAIIDTGVDYTHSDLGGCLGPNCKVEGGYDLINNDSDPMDDMGHGTHVAATAAGSVFRGVAPDAKVYAYKVLDQYGSGYFDTVIAGIEKSIDPNGDGDLSDGVDVISLSLGGYGDPDDPQSQAIDNAVKSGVVAIVAAGNSGPDYQTIGSPGTAREAITVGATTKQDELIYFSSRGPVVWKNQTIVKPDITAPGVSICAAEWGGWLSDYRCKDDKHIAISGTSMATPHVAGLVALIKQAHPEWTPEQIKSALKSTATDIVDANTLEKGAGRINALKVISLSTTTIPVVKIYPIANTGVKRAIYGEIKTDKLKSWSLSYLPIAETGFTSPQWKKLLTSKEMPKNSKFYDFNTAILSEGEHIIIKLLAIDQNNQSSFDYGYIKVDNMELVNPLNWDILRAGDNIPLRLKNKIPQASISNIVWEYGIGKTPSVWKKIDNKSSWDTKGLTTGDYVVRVKVNHDNIKDVEQAQIHLDSTLKKGWPVRVGFQETQNDCGVYVKCNIWSGYLVPIVDDINGDSINEIIVYQEGNPDKLKVYDLNGKERWKTEIADNDGALYSDSGQVPVVVDLNNDGKKEIIVHYSGSFSGNTQSSVYAFDYQGHILSGWPIKIKAGEGSKIIMADLNNDGEKEIIIKQTALDESGEKWVEGFVILKKDGSLLTQFNFPYQKMWGGFENTPAVGNFDTDNDLEIVYLGQSSDGLLNGGEIHMLNLDGTEVVGWPKKNNGMLLSSPAVGDLDKDGKDEVVVGLSYASDAFPDYRYGGLYVFDRNGNVLPGWPVNVGYNFWSSPSLADLDNDGDLEIIASRLGFETYAYHHNGQLVSGWPQTTGWNDYYSTVTGDINGDNKIDILTTAGDHPYVGGGVYAWNSFGSMINGFPKSTEVDAQAPATIFKDKNGKVSIVASSDWDYTGTKGKNRGSLYIWETTAKYDEKNMPWPTFHHDVQRTGLFGQATTSADKIFISFISPDSGVVGDKVKISGNGFMATGNTINFGDGIISNVKSDDGKMIEFSIPAVVNLPCYDDQIKCLAPAIIIEPGVYSISVSNTNGVSNKIKFKVAK